MPSPQFTEKRLWIIVIFCPERAVFAIMIRHRKPPDKRRERIEKNPGMYSEKP
jgi:hypothetical protein